MRKPLAFPAFGFVCTHRFVSSPKHRRTDTVTPCPRALVSKTFGFAFAGSSLCIRPHFCLSDTRLPSSYYTSAVPTHINMIQHRMCFQYFYASVVAQFHGISPVLRHGFPYAPFYGTSVLLPNGAYIPTSYVPDFAILSSVLLLLSSQGYPMALDHQPLKNFGNELEQVRPCAVVPEPALPAAWHKFSGAHR